MGGREVGEAIAILKKAPQTAEFDPDSKGKLASGEPI